jgi:hypothetical protein
MGVLRLQLLNHELLIVQLLLPNVSIVLDQRYLQLVDLILLVLDHYLLLLVKFKVLVGLHFKLLGSDQLEVLELHLALLRLQFSHHLLNDSLVGAQLYHNCVDFCSVPDLKVVHHLLQIVLADCHCFLRALMGHFQVVKNARLSLL